MFVCVCVRQDNRIEGERQRQAAEDRCDVTQWITIGVPVCV